MTRNKNKNIFSETRDRIIDPDCSGTHVRYRHFPCAPSIQNAEIATKRLRIITAIPCANLMTATYREFRVYGFWQFLLLGPLSDPDTRVRVKGQGEKGPGRASWVD